MARARERAHLESVAAAVVAAGGPPLRAVSGHRRDRAAELRAWGPRADVAAIVLADEDGVPFDALLPLATSVHQYHLGGDSPAGVRAMPLGTAAPDRPLVPWAARDLDVVFWGHAHARRAGMLRGLGLRWSEVIAARLGRVPAAPGADALGLGASEIQFTAKFGAGLAAPDYASRLARARIAICPPGTKQPETFRHHEALRAGCAIACEPARDHPWLGPAPKLEVEDWTRLGDVLRRALADPRRVEDVARAGRAYWEGALSPSAVARRISSGR